MHWFAKINRLLMLFILFFISASAFSDEYQLPKFNMHRGVTPMSQDIFDLHMTVFFICVAIGIVVFGVLITALILHRKSRGVKPAQFHENQRIEIIWAVVPFIILVAMAIPATIVVRDMYNYEKSDITIKITGYQWKWKYTYLNEGISFFSNLATPLSEIDNKTKKDKWYLLQVDKPLVLPINTKIRFLITSNDVIHSWWMPALGIKKDAVPGFIHESWAKIQKPGVYRGQCAELCGPNHGFMPIVVVAKTKPEFAKWVAEERKKEAEAKAKAGTEKLTYDELMKLGEQDYNTYCAACHQADGRGIKPIYPALRASSVAVGKPISRHIDIILNGIPGTAMQAFKDQLSDKQIAAIVTYERNAWENDTGDIVQPAEVQQQREGVKKEEQVNPSQELKPVTPNPDQATTNENKNTVTGEQSSGTNNAGKKIVTDDQTKSQTTMDKTENNSVDKTQQPSTNQNSE